MKTWLPGMLLALFIATGAVAEQETLPPLDEAFDRGTIVIESSQNGCYKFDVHIASTRQQQRRGLMFVRELGEFNGMLFVYARPDILSMWMKNTYIPLDILFIKADGQVSSVATHTEPLSLQSISAAEQVRYVLELNAGVTDRLGIDSSSRLLFSPPE